MKNIILRFCITTMILLAIRYIYVTIVNVSFFDGVFISTYLGFLTSQIILDVLINKGRKKKV